MVFDATQGIRVRDFSNPFTGNINLAALAQRKQTLLNGVPTGQSVPAGVQLEMDTLDAATRHFAYLDGNRNQTLDAFELERFAQIGGNSDTSSPDFLDREDIRQLPLDIEGRENALRVRKFDPERLGVLQKEAIANAQYIDSDAQAFGSRTNFDRIKAGLLQELSQGNRNSLTLDEAVTIAGRNPNPDSVNGNYIDAGDFPNSTPSPSPSPTTGITGAFLKSLIPPGADKVTLGQLDTAWKAAQDRGDQPVLEGLGKIMFHMREHKREVLTQTEIDKLTATSSNGTIRLETLDKLPDVLGWSQPAPTPGLNLAFFKELASRRRRNTLTYGRLDSAWKDAQNRKDTNAQEILGKVLFFMRRFRHKTISLAEIKKVSNAIGPKDNTMTIAEADRLPKVLKWRRLYKQPFRRYDDDSTYHRHLHGRRYRAW